MHNLISAAGDCTIKAEFPLCPQTPKNIVKLRRSLVWAAVLLSPIVAFSPAHLRASDGVSLQWALSAPLPEPRSDYAAGALDGRLVIAGGTYWEGSKGHWIKKHFSASTHAFDPIAQRWEKLPDLPTPLACAASAVIGNRLFVLGGYTGTKLNRTIYTLAKESGRYRWSEFGTLPVDRLFAGAVSVGSRLFLVGGTAQFEPTDSTGTCCTSRTATNGFMEFDTLHPEKGWSQLAPLPGPLRWFFSAVTDGKSIWVFGGRSQVNPHDPIRQYAPVFRYDLARAAWQDAAPLPAKSPDAVPPSPVMAKGMLILVTDHKEVWQFDPQTSTYTDLTPLPEDVAIDRFVCLGDRIVGAGGENNVEGPRRRSEWTFIGRVFNGNNR